VSFLYVDWVMGKRAENKKQNEQAILSAGIQLFVSKGFEETSISDIVSATGLARGTFYNYFASKEEIWDAFLAKLLTTVNVSLIEERKKAETVEAYLYNTFFSYVKILSVPPTLDLIVRNQSLFRKTLFSSDSLVSIYTHLEQDLAKSPFFKGLSPQQLKLITYSMGGAGIEMLIQTHVNQETILAEELAAFFQDMFMGGIKALRAEKGE